jgi:hypothetical protein
MGFFSWKTQDTNKSISNQWSIRGTFKVYMLDDKGNVWEEYDYDGLGVFEGKDYYELLAEMNGLGSDRIEGINLASKYDFKSHKDIKYPNLVEDIGTWEYTPNTPDNCEYQGYFY